MLKKTLAVSEYDVFKEFEENFHPDGKTILEVGGCLPYNFLKDTNVEKWIAIDPRNNDAVLNENYISICGYAQLIPFEDNTFDYIFSCNCFQHISAFSHALDEMYRVLKPGGILFSNFGPIWSGPDGSHIENVKYGDDIYNFWEKSLIPDWYHLIYSFRELYDILSTELEKGLAQKLVEYVYLSNWLNRLKYSDYKIAIQNSRFKLEYFEGITDFGYKRTVPEYKNKYSSKINNWKQTLGSEIDDYKYRDLKIVLKK